MYIYNCKLSYRVIHRLIQHGLLSKMVYLNAKYVIATRSYEFFKYTQNLIGNITLLRVINIHSFSKLRGPSIKYVTLFLANFDPPTPCHTLLHIPGPPESTSHILDQGRRLVINIGGGQKFWSQILGGAKILVTNIGGAKIF